MLTKKRLNDEDHRVHAAWQMGHVFKQVTEKRGTFTGRFFLAGEDVTQSVNRLHAAGMIDTTNARWNMSERLIAQVQEIISRRKL